MSTGPNSEIRARVLARANFVCEICGGPLESMSIHHRRPRGMGGTKNPWINEPENLLAICGTGTTGCHGWLESHRLVAYTHGWLLRTGAHPAETPWRDNHDNWWLPYGDMKLRFIIPH